MTPEVEIHIRTALIYAKLAGMDTLSTANLVREHLQRNGFVIEKKAGPKPAEIHSFHPQQEPQE